ncbi:EF-P beta-lysylation protein EpmB [Gynuella sunshinyii]|uniref:EF-P beta-lysylation protein EpmB n=1 Tax=Gynuella sunshinyii TaxID=1445505 RepID=UPI001FE07B6B|nr:EF-P beta-lysylation protein EpmB [Gynuella sunshinyii]
MEILNWRDQLKEMFRTPEALLSHLNLAADQNHSDLLGSVVQGFSLKVTRHYASLMRKGDWNDPLLLQVLPQIKELDVHPGFVAEPLQEHEAMVLPGLIHKYAGRILLVLGGACAVNCRYCFRRNFDYADQGLSDASTPAVIEYIRNDPSITEVILSGGDPLLWPTRRLKSLTTELSAISHLKTLRVHSRVPVVLPDRLDREFCEWWNALPLKKVMVLHANHGNEFSDQMHRNLKQLAQTTLLNQAVLLAGVNDNVPALTELCQRGFEMGVLPYYLHLLDKVRGAGHFLVTDQKARLLMEQLSHNLPGYLVPKLVREVPGELSKTPIS